MSKPIRKNGGSSKGYLPIGLFATGCFFGLVGFYLVGGWVQDFFLVLTTVSFVASYWLSSLKGTEPE
jgi:hypothetical protein